MRRGTGYGPESLMCIKPLPQQSLTLPISTSNDERHRATRLRYVALDGGNCGLQVMGVVCTICAHDTCERKCGFFVSQVRHRSQAQAKIISHTCLNKQALHVFVVDNGSLSSL